MADDIKLHVQAGEVGQPKDTPDFLNSAKTNVEVQAFIAKGTTKAKTAKVPTKNYKFAEKIKEAQKNESKLNSPSELARCRAVVGSDILAAILLYRMVYLYNTINPKMKRNGKEYLAMKRDDLALSAGLTFSEMKNRALPRVRNYASEIVDIQAMGNGKAKKLWFRIDMAAYAEALDKGGYELKVWANEGQSLYK